MLSQQEYHKFLKYLYFEGYADSYENAEYLIREMTDDEFSTLLFESRLPRLSEEMSRETMERRAGESDAANQERKKKRMAQLRNTSDPVGRTRDTMIIRGSHKGRKGAFHVNRQTGERNFVPDDES